MRIKSCIWSILLLSGICTALSAQGRYIPGIHIEAGTGINLSYFDVGGGSPGASFQGGVLYDLSPEWRIGASVGVHRARGSDIGTLQSARGYEFRSNINEISAKGVYTIRFRPYPVKRWKQKIEPRIYASLGIIQFQPKPNELLAAHKNGDPLPVAPLFAGGLGLVYHMDRNISILFEGGGNTSTSDYLEGFSDPENLSIPDFYITMLVKFIYKVPSIWK